MKISVCRLEKATILDLPATINISHSSELKKVLLQAIREEGASRVVVNLANVVHIDDLMAASLVQGLKESQSKGVRFVLSGMSNYARESLQVMRLLSLFTVCDDEGQAITV